MAYRKLSADRIFDGSSIQKDKVLIIKEDGAIQEIVSIHEAGEEVESYSGVLTPGFINCHCHTELSHLQHTVSPGLGLIGFLLQVVQARKTINEGKEAAIEQAMAEMWAKGIAGVGDICNTTDALPFKLKSNLEWHNFIEVLNFSDATLEHRIGHFSTIQKAHEDHGLKAVLSGHAPYSLTADSWKAINKATAGAIVSVHNQETAAENDLFMTGHGGFDDFYMQFHNRLDPFPAIGHTSLQTWLPHFTSGQTIFLVHNLFLSEGDIVFAKEHAERYGLRLVFCLCPNANLYIENRLPPVDLLLEYQCQVVIGTDSYSSNYELSIASEVKTMQHYFPHISLETLLDWATGSGARALGWEHLGHFEKGKRPGVVLLQDDFAPLRLI